MEKIYVFAQKRKIQYKQNLVFIENKASEGSFYNLDGSWSVLTTMANKGQQRKLNDNIWKADFSLFGYKKVKLKMAEIEVIIGQWTLMYTGRVTED